LRSAQSVSRAINSFSGSSMNSCPLPRQDASDPQNAPGGGAFVCEDSSSPKRVAAALASVVAETGRIAIYRDDRIPERTHTEPGKAPRQGISSSRVEADCPRIVNPSRPIRLLACGNVVEYAVCCGLRWKTWTRNLEREMRKTKRARFSLRP